MKEVILGLRTPLSTVGTPRDKVLELRKRQGSELSHASSENRAEFSILHMTPSGRLSRPERSNPQSV